MYGIVPFLYMLFKGEHKKDEEDVKEEGKG